MSPSLGQFGAVALSSPAIAPFSPRSSGWADTETDSEQESAPCTPRKRKEKHKHASLYQPSGLEEQYYHPEDLPQYSMVISILTGTIPIHTKAMATMTNTEGPATCYHPGTLP